MIDQHSMSFNDLAPELLFIIADHLHHSKEDRLSKYATLSTAFRGAVESLLFSRVNFSSDELEDFERVVWSRSTRTHRYFELLYRATRLHRFRMRALRERTR
jgi:hypothetical protein